MVSNKCLVSVIVPIYNVEQYLDTCITSIINQSYKQLQIILINDGSQDSSLAICQKYVQRDERIQLINKSNSGLSDARNVGITCAKGEYILFVDSDDCIHPDMIEALVVQAGLCDADVVMCGYEKFDEDRQLVNLVKEINNNAVICYEKSEIVKNISESRDLLYIVVWNKLYNRKLFAEIRFPVGKIYEDEFVSFRILYSCKKLAYLRQSLYYYRQRADSIMGKGFSVECYNRIEALRSRVEFFIKNKCYEKENIRQYFWEYAVYINQYKRSLFYSKELLDKYLNEFALEKEKYRKYFTNWEYTKQLIILGNIPLYKRIKKFMKL